MGIEKKVYSFRLETQLIERLQTYANEENRSLSNMVETVLKRYVAQKDKEPNTNEPSV